MVLLKECLLLSYQSQFFVDVIVLISDGFKFIQLITKVGDLLLIKLKLVLIFKQDSLELIHFRDKISLLVVSLGDILVGFIQF